jgi:hypothetical protein
MKPAWFAAFALPFLCSSLSHPQQTSPVVPTQVSSTQAKAAPAPEAASAVPALTEQELRARLVGKPLYLRGLWLDDDLHFDLNGKLVSTSPRGSFTLCAVEIDRVRLTKRRIELEGVRYGIHFADEASWADQATSFDRIRITPKKKHLEIAIDRLEVVKPKKKSAAGKKGAEKKTAADGVAAVEEKEAGTTTSPAESAEQVRKALDRIFAPELDAQMVAAMPDYWQYFYQAQRQHQSMEPTDPNIVRPGPGVQGPVLVKNVAPDSNDYAQKSEVAGVASYEVILGADGKPMAVGVYRPIGFGLDENAVAAIRKSTFTPAMKGGKPVASVIDLAVNFRIYSERTARTAPAVSQNGDTASTESPVTGKPSLPGLYTAEAGQP